MDNSEKKWEKTLDAVWAWDSETGEKVLLDRKTGQVLMTWKHFEGSDEN